MIRPPEKFRESGIDVRTLHEVVEIDTVSARVRWKRVENGSEGWEPYDALVIATGASPVCPNVPGDGVRGIYGVCNLQAGIILNEVLDRDRPRRAVVIGGGYIGLEMAEALIRRGLEVTLVDRGRQVMGTLDPDMGRLVADGLEKVGVVLRQGEQVVAFDAHRGNVSAVITSNGEIPCDLVVLGTGVRPNSRLAEDAGISLGVKKAIRTDGRLRTSAEGVWAAGDCAETFHLVTGKAAYIPLGTVANRQGRVCGIDIAGGDAVFPGVVGTAITKICSLEIARTGLHEAEAAAAGIDFVAATIESRTHAGYYPGSAPITVKMLAERQEGKLLGAQIVGGPGSGKRIDVVATCLHAGFDLQQMVDLDLAYAPPFSGVWDPVQVAARKLLKSSEQ